LPTHNFSLTIKIKQMKIEPKTELEKIIKTPVVKVVVAGAAIALTIILAGQIMRILTTAVIHYKSLSRALQIPTTATKA
jgi:hypothetical protein